ncbi:MAG: VWA domain-containing protein [Chloroflexi bacterium]|nr:VWA domain-containing protein [Chloroflexota bacterium]
MPYSAEISRRNPTCFLFLVDQSGSMADPFGSGGANIQKAGFVADALNRTLQNLVIACAKDERSRDYFWVGVVGYGAGVGPAFSGNLAGQGLVPISAIADNPARVEERMRRESDGAGGIIEVPFKFPVWFDPKAVGGTPMCQALDLAQTTLAKWIGEHPDAFPPVVLHITDGESTDGDPTGAAGKVMSLSTSDGDVLLFNLHASSRKASPVSFPSSEAQLPADDFAYLLFRLSSPLPPHMLVATQATGHDAVEGARGFVFNAGIDEVADFLRIGTQPANLR